MRNRYVNVGNTLTIEAWVKPTDLDNRYGIFSGRLNDGTGRFQLEVGAGTNRVAVTSPGTYVAQTNDHAIAPNEWTHIAYTRSGEGATHKIYINGVAQTLISNADYTFSDHSGDKVIGSGTSGGNLLPGQIDELRVWSVARTETQIRDNMHKTLNGDETNLVAYYRFNHISGTGLDDLTTNNNDGTLMSMTDADWVASTVPIGNGAMQSQNDVRAIWTGGSTTAGPSGLIIANSSFLQDTGDDMVFGHNNLTGNTISDLPASGWSNGQRWTRVWYLDKSDVNSNGGNVDITFDFGEGGMSGTPGGVASNYRLLERSGDSGPFADITSATSISGDQVIFSGVNSNELGSYYTLGTVNKDDSPTAVTLARFVARPAGGGNGFVLALALLALGAVGGALVVWARRRRPGRERPA